MKTAIFASVALAASINVQAAHDVPDGYPVIHGLELEDNTLYVSGANMIIDSDAIGYAIWFADEPQALDCVGDLELLACDIPVSVVPNVAYAVTAKWWQGDKSLKFNLSVMDGRPVIDSPLGVITTEPVFVYHTSTTGRGGIVAYTQKCSAGTPIMGNIYLGMDVLDWSVKSSSVREDANGELQLEMKFVKVPRTDGGQLVDVGTGFEAHGQIVCIQ